MDYFIIFRTVDGLNFNEMQKAIVHRATVEVAEHWNYEVHAIEVLANGVHLLMSGGEREPRFIMTGMKAWSTKHLRENRTMGAKQPVWIKGGDVVPVEEAAEFERIRLMIESGDSLEN